MSVTRLKPGAGPSDSWLIADLAAESGAVQRFIAVLNTEQRALKENFADSLEQLAREKSALATELNRLQARRERAAAGTPGGIKAWIARSGGPAAVQSWRELTDLASQARQLNHVNGILIDTLLRNNRQALNLLQGAAQRASLYGADGRTQNYSGGRMLGAV
jgi:flagellar biosynthesis protein FlgN